MRNILQKQSAERLNERTLGQVTVLFCATVQIGKVSVGVSVQQQMVFWHYLSIAWCNWQ
jgi:hypothetical protein